MRLFAVLLSMLSCSLLYAAPIEVPIKGKVVDEYNQGLAGVSISVKGNVFTSNATGDFTLSLAKNDVYQLSLLKKDFYSSVQTLSHFELTRNAYGSFVILQEGYFKSKYNKQ
jgi:hypothetical protein